MNKLSQHPCPICKELMFLIGKEGDKKLTSCGHKYKFKKTRSQKEMDRKYIRTPDGGLELATTLMDEMEKCSPEMQEAMISIVKKEGF